ncbi:MAG: ABC transporter ATP-binding protein [Lachnospiraceae bacterium]|nr:ABC transporter ATP-binding protein [Lachnospiraceae bacterium]
MIKLENVCKVYNNGRANQTTALKNIDLEIKAGEMVVITGPSGSGKSTLLHILALMDEPTSGSYLFDGEMISGMTDRQKSEIRNRKLGIILQDYGLVDELTAIQNVELPLMIAGKRKRAARMAARNALRMVGLSEKERQKTSRLSGGQRQRVSIARAIVAGAKLILADEPTGALDSVAAGDFMELMTGLNRNGVTVVIVTHNETVANQCKRQLRLVDGEIIP